MGSLVHAAHAAASLAAGFAFGSSSGSRLESPGIALALVLLAITFAVALPSSPGFVGTFRRGFMLAASALGIDRNAAAATAIVTHGLSQGPFIVAGAAVVALHGRALVAGTPRMGSPPKTSRRRLTSFVKAP